jgi:hypothetical protein
LSGGVSSINERNVGVSFKKEELAAATDDIGSRKKKIETPPARLLRWILKKGGKEKISSICFPM